MVFDDVQCCFDSGSCQDAQLWKRMLYALNFAKEKKQNFVTHNIDTTKEIQGNRTQETSHP